MTLASMVAGILLGAAPTPDGAAIFKEMQCAECHGVKAAKIDEPKGAKEDEKGPDLSGVTSRHKPEWIAGYLKKKEKLDGAKHKKKFRGTDAELDALLKWLGQFSAPAKP